MTIDRFRILLAEINEYQIDEEDNYYFLSELFNDLNRKDILVVNSNGKKSAH